MSWCSVVEVFVIIFLLNDFLNIATDLLNDFHNLVAPESLIEIHFFEHREQFAVLGGIAVVDKYELVNRRIFLEILLKVMIQRFRDILVDVDNTLIFLQFRYIDNLIGNLCVDIPAVRRTLRIDAQMLDKVLDIEYVEVLQVDYQPVKFLCWFRSHVYVHSK